MVCCVYLFIYLFIQYSMTYSPLCHIKLQNHIISNINEDGIPLPHSTSTAAPAAELHSPLGCVVASGPDAGTETETLVFSKPLQERNPVVKGAWKSSGIVLFSGRFAHGKIMEMFKRDQRGKSLFPRERVRMQIKNSFQI